MAGLTSLGALEGRWVLRRVIRHDDGTENHFDGWATFARSGKRLICDEEGTLSGLPGQPPIKATRRYIWLQEPGRIEVLFDDMRPFHTIPLGAAHPSTTYLCPPDRYEVSYDFTDLAQWHATWRVEGPKKSYTMESTFRHEARRQGAA